MNARTLFTLNAVLLVLLAISAPFVEVGSGAFVVSVISLVLITISMIGVGALLWRQRRQQNHEEMEKPR